MARRRRNSRKSSIFSLNRKNQRRTRKISQHKHYGSVFFAVLAVTVASTIGFFGIVASVLAGS